MNVVDVKSLSLLEKLQLMESIWEDLRASVDTCPISEAHKVLLKERKERVESGEANIRDWDDVKDSLGHL